MKTTSSVTTESKGGRADVWEANKNWGAQKRRKEKTNKKDPEGNYTGVHINQKEGKEKNNCRGAQQTRTQQQKNVVKTDTTGRWASAFSFSLYSTTTPTRKRERKKTITIISHVFTLYAVSARPRSSSEL